MYYMKIRTRYNEIKLILEDDDFYNENLQQLLQQEYVDQVYLRWVSEKEYNKNPQYTKVKRLARKND